MNPGTVYIGGWVDPRLDTTARAPASINIIYDQMKDDKMGIM
jgi:hypothetical protein